MMKKVALFIVALAFACPLRAQEMDEELATIVSWVIMLRDGSSASYSRVQEQLKNDTKWTLMNETGILKEQECRPSEIDKRFKLNRILSQVDGGRKYVSTHGDMLNGEDERYDYSLYERSVKANAVVEYTLKGREGRQVFVVVPYDACNSGLTATISFGEGDAEDFYVREDGSLIYFGNTPDLERNDMITITVANASASNQAFVLLNHNTRNK